MPIELNPGTAAALAAGAIILTFTLIILTARRMKKRKGSRTKGGIGVNLIFLRGRNIGKIVPDCVFTDGWYTYNPDDQNPVAIPYDGDFVRHQPDGQPFMFYDLDARCPVHYGGVCDNDGDVTLVFHDGRVKDVPYDQAQEYHVIEDLEPDPAKVTEKTVFRKHASLWKRWPGSRIFSEKTTMDWDVIHQSTATWLTILNKFGGLLILVAVILLVIVLGVVLLR